MAYETAVVISDLQIPFHSKRALSAVRHFLNATSVDALFINGDLLDFAGLTLKYVRDPRHRLKLEADVNEARAVLKMLRDASPRSKRYFIEGNHERRWYQYIEERADEFAWLLEGEAELNLGRALRLSENGYEHIAPYGAGVEWHSILITHGTHARKHSGQSAHAEWDEAGTSGISGHTHRGGMYYRTNRYGAHAWAEGFCLCNLSTAEGPIPPGFKEAGVRDWQQGFVMLEWTDSHEPIGRASTGGVWAMHPIAMTDQSFLWNGTLYTPEGGRNVVREGARLLQVRTRGRRS